MTTALILAGGIGSRLKSSIPKQYIMINGKPIISYCITVFSLSNHIDAIWIVAASEWNDQLVKWIGEADVHNKFKGISKPGANRQLSIYNGILDIKRCLPATESVLIHDAARPLVREGDITACIGALKEHDGVVPVLKMKDTVYISDNGKAVSSLINRSSVYIGQAPELFMLDKYIHANEILIRNENGSISDDSLIFKITGSAEPAVMFGMDIALIEGNEENFKITTDADLNRFKLIMEGLS